MASKRKRNQGENNGSSRNLDGRRLRTVTEAKALAEYLAVKPEMDKKEKENRRQRWQQVLELAEKRESEIKVGSKSKVNGQWIEDKEEAVERTREAVLAAMSSGNYTDNTMVVDRITLGEHQGHTDDSSGDGDSDSDSGAESLDIQDKGNCKSLLSRGAKQNSQVAVQCFGYGEEEDEFMSDESEESIPVTSPRALASSEG